MIILARDTAAVQLDVGPSAACVHHADYVVPRLPSGMTCVEAGRFLTDPEAILTGCKTLVVVGLSRILTPSNRTKVGPYLLRPRSGLRRISVDKYLFVSEPWRAWWHFGCVGARYSDYSYSFLAESHWRGAQDGMRADPFSLDEIKRWGVSVIRSLDDGFFDEPTVTVVKLSAEAHTDYTALKERAFNEEHTSSGIIKRLAAFAQAQCAARRVPTAARLFDKSAHRIVRTDLKVDEWLVSQLLARVELTNGVAATFRTREAAA